MTYKFRQLQLQALDEHLAKVHVAPRPSGGWVRAIRTALGMSARQLAERMGVSQQALSRLESKEAVDAVTIKTLRRAAEAMGCQVVYAVIPGERSLQDIVDEQALKKASELVGAVDHTMKLEAQEVGDVEDKTRQVAGEMAVSLNTSLWE
jgi:predicted DNA-binding mobile mystery protein A